MRLPGLEERTERRDKRAPGEGPGKIELDGKAWSGGSQGG